MIPLFLIPPLLALLLIRGPKGLGHGLAIALLVWLGKSEGVRSLTFLTYAMNGVFLSYVIAFAVRSKRSLFQIAFLALSLELLFQFLVGEVAVYREAYRLLLDAASRTVTQWFKMADVSEKMANLQWGVLIPFSEALKSILLALVLGYFFHRLVYGEQRRFSEFAIPYPFVWVFAAALGISLYAGGSRSANLLLCGAVALYLVNGVSVIRLYFEQPGRSKVGEYLVYALQLWLFFIPVFLLGILEHWLELRTKILAVESDVN